MTCSNVNTTLLTDNDAYEKTASSFRRFLDAFKQSTTISGTTN